MKNDAISKALKKATKNWNIEEVAQAVIADDPDVAVIQDDLLAALADVKRGKLARETQVNISPIAETRRKVVLSQRLFAERLGISINTLKSWEQGKREPSGSAKALLKLITKKPELMAELA